MSPRPFPPAAPKDTVRPRRRWAMRLRRGAPVVALLGVALAAYLTGAIHMLAPAALGREEAQLHDAIAAAPALAFALYVVGYAVLTGACLPVALVLSLTGGALFGVWAGTLGVLLGATGGALLTYAAARSAFAPLLRARAQRDPRLKKLLAGFERRAFTYVLTLRLIPMAPFALVNIASGLAAAPARAFTLASLIGGVPTALIYAGLGAGLGSSLASRDSIQEALRSPRLLLPLAGLALLSLAPMLATRLRRRAQPES